VLLTDSLAFAFTDEVATGFLGAVVDGLAPTGLAVTLLTSDGGDGDVVPARDVAIDGALLYSCHVESAARSWLLRRNLPVVFVDQDPVRGVSSVNVDDRGGARAAAEHLVALGHRDVGIISHSVDRGSVEIVENPLPPTMGHPQKERMRGWLEALSNAGVSPTVVQHRANNGDTGEPAARALLAAERRPSAVLCFSDAIALAVIRAARALDLDVPGDLSVVGFDDSPSARHSDPALTTVHQDVAAKGRLAAAALIAALERARTGASGRVRHRVLPTTLVVRDSTAAPPRRRRR
jgi:DNA-binding LacI/PurR family transcriptional regulator